MTKFKFYFACLFIAMILKQTGNSWKTYPNLTKPKVKEELELAKIAMRALRKNKWKNRSYIWCVIGHSQHKKETCKLEGAILPRQKKPKGDESYSPISFLVNLKGK